MNSQELGASTSDVEVANIDRHGIWLFAMGAEYFLPYSEYPWFKAAKVADILNIELLHGDHVHWPVLDVDLSLKSLRNPEAYPLIYQ
jgi:ribosomal protein S1